MNKRKILLAIPLFTIFIVLIYCWYELLSAPYIPAWQHYLAVVLFVIIIVLYFINFTATLVATFVYLILASFNIVSLIAGRDECAFIIAGFSSPHFQITSLLILILFCVLNFDTAVNIYLDYKERTSKI